MRLGVGPVGAEGQEVADASLSVEHASGAVAGADVETRFENTRLVCGRGGVQGSNFAGVGEEEVDGSESIRIQGGGAGEGFGADGIHKCGEGIEVGDIGQEVGFVTAANTSCSFDESWAYRSDEDLNVDWSAPHAEGGGDAFGHFMDFGFPRGGGKGGKDVLEADSEGVQ